jgi:hypothetical protein
MSVMAAPVTGFEAFTAGLAAQGIEAERRGSLLVYRVEPVFGGQAGQPVETALPLDELTGWPTTPPHWIHVHADLNIPAAQDSGAAGWSKYSRPYPGRLDADPNPTRAWIAHVREFLGHAP